MSDILLSCVGEVQLLPLVISKHPVTSAAHSKALGNFRKGVGSLCRLGVGTESGKGLHETKG